MSHPRVLVVGYNAFDVTIPFAGTPLPDTKNEVSFIGLGGGGPGATAAVALARLGARVKLITPLTDDLPGRLQERNCLRPALTTPYALECRGTRQPRRSSLWMSLRSIAPFFGPGAICH